MIEDGDKICEYCKNMVYPQPATQWHHITYNPDTFAALCSSHHRDITRINTLTARILKRKLLPAERFAIYTVWINRLITKGRGSKRANGFNKFWLGKPQDFSEQPNG